MRRIATHGLIALILTGLAPAAVAYPWQDDLDLVESYGDLDRCPPTAVEVGRGSNGAATWMLLQEPSDSNTPSKVYAAWSLVTNNLRNGADGWLFGVQLMKTESPTRTFLQEYRGGACEFVSYYEPEFRYVIIAGAYGWETERSCSVTHSWSVTGKVAVKLTGPEGEVSGTFGGSYTCSNGARYDSELIFNDKGKASPLPDTIHNALERADAIS